MPSQTKAASGLLTHDNYSAGTGPSTKTLPRYCTTILIQNMDATNNVLISFDGGVKFKTILANSILALDVANVSSYQVKSSASTVDVEALYGSEI